MKFKRTKSALIVTLSMIILSIPVQSNAAGSASFSLSPSGGSYDKNSTLSITVSVNTSENVNAVQANMSYDSSKLQYLSISTSGSAFDISAEATGGSGNVKIGRGSISGVSGSGKKVATVKFKVLAGSGSSTVSFVSSSAIVRSSDASDAWNGNTAGGTYNFKTPASTPTPKPSTTPAPSSSSSSDKPQPVESSDEDTPEKDIKKPAEEPVVVDKVNQNSSNYPVSITVEDGSGTVKGAKVTLNGETIETDSNGVASFVSVPEGTYTASVSINGGESIDQTISVTDGDPAEVQSFSLVIPTESDGIGPVITIGGVVLFIGLLSGLAWYMYSKSIYTKKGTGTNENVVIGGSKPTDTTVSSNAQTQSETVIRPTESTTNDATKID